MEQNKTAKAYKLLRLAKRDKMDWEDRARDLVAAQRAGFDTAEKVEELKRDMGAHALIWCVNLAKYLSPEQATVQTDVVWPMQRALAILRGDM